MKNKLILLVIVILLIAALITLNSLDRQDEPVKSISSHIPMSIETTPKEQISDCKLANTTCTQKQGILFVQVKDTSTQHGDLIATPDYTIQVPQTPDYNKAITAIQTAAHDNTIRLVPYLVNLKMTWYCDDIENCVAVDNQAYTLLRKDK